MRIKKNLIKRFDEFKSYILESDNIYGEYWTKEGQTFDVLLTLAAGYSTI
jgi:phage regulator Rha-like protein